MKTEEDEAFDELAKRQGAWGGGFKAKQGMAMHKTQDQNICRHYKQWQHCHICDLESQAAELAGIKAILDEYGLQAIDFVADFKAALAQPAHEPDCQATGVCVRSGLYVMPLPVQPVQEPVAWITPDGEGFRIRFSPPTNDVPLGWDALYTAPQPAQEPVVCLDCGSHNVGIPATYDSLINSVKALNT